MRGKGEGEKAAKNQKKTVAKLRTIHNSDRKGEIVTACGYHPGLVFFFFLPLLFIFLSERDENKIRTITRRRKTDKKTIKK